MKSFHRSFIAIATTFALLLGSPHVSDALAPSSKLADDQGDFLDTVNVLSLNKRLAAKQEAEQLGAVASAPGTPAGVTLLGDLIIASTHPFVREKALKKLQEFVIQMAARRNKFKKMFDGQYQFMGRFERDGATLLGTEALWRIQTLRRQGHLKMDQLDNVVQSAIEIYERMRKALEGSYYVLQLESAMKFLRGREAISALNRSESIPEEAEALVLDPFARFVVWNAYWEYKVAEVAGLKGLSALTSAERYDLRKIRFAAWTGSANAVADLGKVLTSNSKIVAFLAREALVGLGREKLDQWMEAEDPAEKEGIIADFRQLFLAAAEIPPGGKRFSQQLEVAEQMSEYLMAKPDQAIELMLLVKKASGMQKAEPLFEYIFQRVIPQLSLSENDVALVLIASDSQAVAIVIPGLLERKASKMTTMILKSALLHQDFPIAISLNILQHLRCAIRSDSYALILSLLEIFQGDRSNEVRQKALEIMKDIDLLIAANDTLQGLKNKEESNFAMAKPGSLLHRQILDIFVDAARAHVQGNDKKLMATFRSWVDGNLPFSAKERALDVQLLTQYYQQMLDKLQRQAKERNRKLLGQYGDLRFLHPVGQSL